MTVALVALVVGPIMVQQGALVRSADRISRRARAVEAAQLFLYETELNIQPGVITHEAQKKIEGTYDMQLTFRRIPVTAQSVFSKFTNLVQDQVVCSWQEFGSPLQEAVVTLRYVVPVPQEKKA